MLASKITAGFIENIRNFVGEGIAAINLFQVDLDKT